jgi:hypothetical protein
MKNIFLRFLLWEIILSTSCLTPKGIDVNPLFNLHLSEGTNLFVQLSNNDSALAKQYNCRLNHVLELGMNAHGQYNNWISLPSTNDTIENIFRGIEIWPYENADEALNQYDEYKKTFSHGSSAHIYKEEHRGKNRYYIIYKGIRFDTNHGIPYAVDNDPELSLGFLINNYFVYISYTKYSTYENKLAETYIQDINNDIVTTSNFLNDIIN